MKCFSKILSRMSVIRGAGSAAALLACGVLLAGKAQSQGFVISGTSDGNVRLVHSAIEVAVTNQVAQFEISQVFQNLGSDGQDIRYYFPASGEDISGLLVKSGDDVLQGRFLSPEESFQILQERVRATSNPSWLALAATRLYEVNLPAFSSQQKRVLTCKYVQVLEPAGGLTTLAFPLPRGNSITGGDARMTSAANYSLYAYNTRAMAEDVSYEDGAPSEKVEVSLKMDSALCNIYSPSHRVKINKQSSDRALVCYSGKSGAEHDFVLFFGTESGAVTGDFLSYRPDPHQDGYFMLTLSSTNRLPASRIISRDIIFVVDVSGTMKGARLREVQTALRRTISSLNDNDFFNIISFNTQIKLFGKNLLSAAESKGTAISFIGGLEARGGANLNEALLTAMNIKGRRDKPGYVFLITDGMPTVGVVDVSGIRNNVSRLNKHGYHIMSVGLGNEVSVDLLDGFAYDSNGISTYVESAEDISVAVEELDKSRKNAVLVAPRIDFGDLKVSEVFPEMIPDLHKGEQVRVVGRYRKDTHSQIQLTGESTSGKSEFVFEVKTGAKRLDSAFLPRIWAARKYGFLLEQQRLDTAKSTADAEITTLCDRYGLPKMDARAPSTGRQAIELSNFSKCLMFCEAPGLLRPDNVRCVGGKVFTLTENGVWRETIGIRGDKALNLTYGSKAYFNFAKNYVQAGKYLAIGKKVIFSFRNAIVTVDDSGREEMSTDELAEIFAKVP